MVAGTVQSTDAVTAQTIASYTVPADGVGATFFAIVNGRDASNNSCGCVISGVFKRTGGATSIVSTAGGTLVMAIGGTAALLTSVVTLDASGTAIRIRVTGVAATTIDWTAFGWIVMS